MIEKFKDWFLVKCIELHLWFDSGMQKALEKFRND
jgi:hypothetical protein